MTHPDNYKEAYELMSELFNSLKEKYTVCRNELCLRCGSYKMRHLGACDGCRWKEDT